MWQVFLFIAQVIGIVMKRNKLYLLALVPFLFVVLLFEILPVAMVIFRSFMPADGFGFTLEHYINIFSKRLYQQAILNSVIISICSSLIGLVVAFFGAKAYQATHGTKKNLFINVLNMTSNFAGIPLAFAYIILLGNVGIIVNFGKAFGVDALAQFNLYSVSGLLLTYIYFQIPLATLLMIPSFKALKKEWPEAVALLGGSSMDYWFKVGLPALIPSLLSTFSILFANAIAAYATAYALMTNNLSLLPIRISEQFVGDVVQRPEFGSALSVILMALMVLSILIKDKVLEKGKRA